MNCRELTAFLHDYLIGDLPAEQRREFESHLAECPSCVAYLESYRMTIQLERATIRAPLDAASLAEAPEELIQAILRARARFS